MQHLVQTRPQVLLNLVKALPQDEINAIVVKLLSTPKLVDDIFYLLFFYYYLFFFINIFFDEDTKYKEHSRVIPRHKGQYCMRLILNYTIIY